MLKRKFGLKQSTFNIFRLGQNQIHYTKDHSNIEHLPEVDFLKLSKVRLTLPPGT